MSSLIPQSPQAPQAPSTHVSPSQGPGAVDNSGLQLPKISFREILNAGIRWCWIPAVCFVLSVIGMYIHVSKKPVFYTSFGSLNIKTRAPEIFSDNPLAQDESNNLEQMKTVEQGLISSTVLVHVAEKNNLADDPIYREVGTEPQAILATLYSRIRVELRKGTRLIDIEVKDTDPARAASIVEDIVEEYEIWKDGGRSELITKASVGLSSEEERLRKKMEESEVQLREFREKNLVLGLTGAQENLQSSRLETLNQEMATVTAERLRLEAEFRAMAALGRGASPPSLAARGARGPVALNLENQLALREAEFAKIKERYLQKHPRYIEAQQELKLLTERMEAVSEEAENTLARDLQIARTREQELQTLVDEAKKSALSDEALREKFSQLTRAAEIDRNLHSQVATRLQETQIGAALNASFLRWDERPLVPIWPSGPNKRGLMLVGAFMGAAVGVILALLASVADPRVREPTAAERKLRLPVLAKLPTYSYQVVDGLSVEGDGLAVLNRPAHLARYTPTPRDEADRMQTLLFVSPFDGDGKSFCVMKCARTMVKQGYRTLVIDADFSESGLSRGYDEQYGSRHGLAAYLMGEAEPAEVLFETGLPGLWFLPTGATESDTGDLLSGPGLRRLLEAISSMFDRVIFDMSSVLQSGEVQADVQAVTRFIDATYLVVQKGSGKYRDLREANEILQSSGGHVTGFIWNEGRRRRRGDLGPVIEPVTYPAEVREVSPKGQNEPMPAPAEPTHQAI